MSWRSGMARLRSGFQAAGCTGLQFTVEYTSPRTPSSYFSNPVSHPSGSSILHLVPKGRSFSFGLCTNLYLQQPVIVQSGSSHPQVSSSRREALIQSQRSAPRRRGSQFYSICSSWNRGQCIFPNTCTFRHVCSTCY